MKYIKYILWTLIVFTEALGLGIALLPDKFYKLTYYTNISNLLILLFFSYLLFLSIRKVKLSPNIYRLKACFTICITLTFLVYHFLLAKDSTPEEFYSIKNITLHYIAPILVIIDFLFFDKRRMYTVLDPVYWSFIPLLYLFFSLVKGIVFQVPIPDEEHSPFPYFFLNLDKYGIKTVAMYCIVILLFYLLVGYIMYAFKNIGTSKDKTRIRY